MITTYIAYETALIQEVGNYKVKTPINQEQFVHYLWICLKLVKQFTIRINMC